MTASAGGTRGPSAPLLLTSASLATDGFGELAAWGLVPPPGEGRVRTPGVGNDRRRQPVRGTATAGVVGKRLVGGPGEGGARDRTPGGGGVVVALPAPLLGGVGNVLPPGGGGDGRLE